MPPPGDLLDQIIDAEIGRWVSQRTSGKAQPMGAAAVEQMDPLAPKNSGALIPGNIDLSNRPRVRNADGSVSTVRSMSIGTDQGEVLIPTISDDGRLLNNEDAIASYRQSGRHLGIFRTPADATAYAQQLHRQQAAQIETPDQFNISDGVQRRPDPNSLGTQLERGHAMDEQAQRAGFLGRTGAAIRTSIGEGIDASTANVDRLLEATRRPGDPPVRPLTVGSEMLGVNEQTRGIAERAGVGSKIIAGAAALPTAFMDPASIGPMKLSAGAGAASVEGFGPIKALLQGIESKAGPKAASAVRSIVEGQVGVGSFSGLHAAASYPNWVNDPVGGIHAVASATEGGVEAGTLFGAAGPLAKVLGRAEREPFTQTNGEAPSRQPQPRPATPTPRTALGSPEVPIAPEPIQGTTDRPTPQEQPNGIQAAPGVREVPPIEGPQDRPGSGETVSPEQDAGATGGALAADHRAEDAGQDFSKTTARLIYSPEGKPARVISRGDNISIIRDENGSRPVPNEKLAGYTDQPPERAPVAPVGETPALESGTIPPQVDTNQAVRETEGPKTDTAGGLVPAVESGSRPLGQRPIQDAQTHPIQESTDAAQVQEPGPLPAREQPQAEAGKQHIPEPPRESAKQGQAQDEARDAGEGAQGVRGVEPAPPAPAETTGVQNAVAAVDRLRHSMGEREAPETRGLEEMYSAGKAAADKDPQATTRLIDALRKDPERIVKSDEEAGLLLKHKVDMENELHRLLKAAKDADESKDAAGERIARIQLLAHREALRELTTLTERAGTAGGRALAARRMMSAMDYSLSHMEATAEAAKGSPLTERELATVKALHEEMRARLAEVEKQRDAAHERLALAEQGGEKIPPAVREVAERFLKRLHGAADQARARIKARGLRLRAGIDPIELADYAIIGADHLARGLTAFAEWSGHMVAELGERIKPHLNDVYKASQERFDAEAATLTGAAKKAVTSGNVGRLLKREADLRSRIERKDFARPEKPAAKMLSPEYRKALADLQETRQKFNKMQDDFEKSQRSLPVKAADYYAKWVRFGALSYPTVFAKLAAAATSRGVTSPVENTLMYVGSRAFKRLGEGASVPTSARTLARSEAAALTRFFREGMRGSFQMLKNKRTELEFIHGKEKLPPELSDYLGRLHGAMKNPTKEAAWARHYTTLTENSILNGEDVSEPMVQMRNSTAAYQRAEAEIFQQDNIIAKTYNGLLENLQRADPETGKRSAYRVAGATVLRAMFPIVKIPLNYVRETGDYIAGVPVATTKIITGYAKGIDTLKPVEKTAILRQLAKGSVGAAAMTLGFCLPQNFGGYYEKGEDRKQDEPKAGGAKVFGHDVPRLLLHNPLFEAIHIGATIRRVADARTSKKQPDPNGLGTGMLAAGLGLIDEVPFVDNSKTIDKLMDPHERESALGALIASKTIPGAVQWSARQLDRNDDGPITRHPKGFGENLMAAIPGLRQDVPEFSTSHQVREKMKDLREEGKRSEATRIREQWNQAHPKDRISEDF